MSFTLSQPLRVVDLFAGGGGLSIGFQNEGFEIVAAFENWEPALDCYRSNLNHPIYSMDLSDVRTASSFISALKPCMIIGGPPCQDFSTSGRRVESDRAALTVSYAEIIANVRPRMFLMENVARAQGSRSYSVARQIFKEAGYGLTEIVVDACYFGVPQHRKRFFCLGMIGAPDFFAQSDFELARSETHTTVRDYFGDELMFDYFFVYPRNYNRRSVFSVDEPSPTIRGKYMGIPSGAPDFERNPIPLRSSDVHILTLAERAKIQTFPDGYQFPCSTTAANQIIGNAVPPLLAQRVASIAMKHLISQ